MEKGHEAIILYFCFAMIITMVSDVTGQGIEGGTMNIACGISGTYTYPGWIKDGSVIITNEGSSTINGAYSPRFSYGADQKTLVVNPVNSTDAGSYECSVTGLLPATTLITVVLPTSAPTTTTSPTTTTTASTTTTSPQAPPTNSYSTTRSAEEKGFTKTIMIIVIICSCGVTAIVVFIVLLVIRRWKHQKEKKSPNEIVDFEGQDVNSLN